MIDRKIMAGVVTSSMCLGLVIGWAIWGRAPDVAGMVVSVVEDRCLPYVSGTGDFDADGLLSVHGDPAYVSYAEKNARFMVETGGKSLAVAIPLRDCIVSDKLALWDIRTRDQVYAEIQKRAPEWIDDRNGETGVVTDHSDPNLWYWIYGPVDQRGYSIGIFRFSAGGDLPDVSTIQVRQRPPLNRGGVDA